MMRSFFENKKFENKQFQNKQFQNKQFQNKQFQNKARFNKPLSREGITGLGLLLLCLVFYGFALHPVQLRLAQLQSTMAALQEKNRRAQHTQKAIKDSTPAEQLRDYYKLFPDPDTTPVLLKKIYAAAHHEGIQLEQGEYRATPEKAGKLIHYQITLPVNGTYLHLRKFLTAVLNTIPTASLDHIRFERQKIGDTEVQAEIKLTLYLQT